MLAEAAFEERKPAIEAEIFAEKGILQGKHLGHGTIRMCGL